VPERPVSAMQTPRTFRVFISSTFSDLKAERDALQRQVFPDLRELCASQGARFQAIDLRWGVSEQASLDQQTIPICLDEIARCQRTTPRPNFLILLGDRYGWRPPASAIPAAEFQELASHVTSPAGRELLAAWYRRDDNAVPAVYCLQPRTERYVDYEVWAREVERPLAELLRRAADAAALPPARRLLYSASATHQEILHGALQVGAAAEHVFCFFRQIQDLPADSHGSDYVDLDPEGRLDQDAYKELAALKTTIRQALPGNVHDYRARWLGRDISNDHLGQLCADVYRQLSRVIIAELARLEALDPLQVELAEHDRFAAERRRAFTGREATLAAIDDYLGGPAAGPLALIGEPGSGKTAVLAQAAHAAKVAHPAAHVIARFVGATPASSSGRSLLESLCRQIARAYGADEETVPSTYRELVDDFPRRLALATIDRPLVLLLDALDQLSPSDRAGDLIWLPAGLPAHVHIVVSTTSGPQSAILDDKLAPANLLLLPAMPVGDANLLLDRWLAAAGRRLQPEQRAHVLAGFASSRLPLYLQLAFAAVRRWESYRPPAELPPDIPGLLRALFMRLSSPANHGKALVARALGYLAAGKNGLAEDELLDLLSADAAVMDEFHRRSPQSPATGCLPGVVWSRLRFDLEPYLAPLAADGTTTLVFYHPTTFGQAVAATYLTDNQGQECHRALAAYFAAQPNERQAPDGSTHAALRKLAELPYQQARGALWPAVERTLTDFGFLLAKVDAAGPWLLVEDYDEALRCGYQGDDLAPLRDALSLSASITAADSTQLAGQLAGRLSGRLSPAVAALLDQVSRWDGAPWLRPARPTLMAAGGPLLHTLRGHTDWVEAVAVTPDGRRAVSAADDGTLRVWDLDRGEELITLRGHTDDVNAVVMTPDGRRAVSASADGTIRVWDLDRALPVLTLEGHDGPVSAVAVTPDGRRVISGGAGRALTLWKLEDGAPLQTLAGHQDWVRAVAVTSEGDRAVSAADDGVLRVWDLEAGTCVATLCAGRGALNDVALTPDGQRALAAGADSRIQVWDLARETLTQTLQGHGDWVRCLAVTTDGRYAYSGSDDRTVRIWDLDRGTPLRTLTGHTESVWGLALTPNSRYAISASGDGTLKIWDPARGEDSVVVLGHPDWGIWGLAVTPDGQRAISASSDSTLKVWDLARGAALHTLTGHTEGVTAVAVTPDSCRAVSGSGDSTLRVWNLERGESVAKLSAHTGRVNAVALTPDGRCAISASHDQSLSVWDLARGREVRSLIGHNDDVTAVVVTPDGQQALSASWDGQLILWDLARGRRLRTFPAGMRGVRAVALTPDGGQCIIGGEDRGLRILDLHSGQLAGVLRGHRGTVWHLAAMPDRCLLSASADHTVRVWDLARGCSLAVFTGESAMRACAAAPNGRTVVAGESQSRLHILHLQGTIGGGGRFDFA
jgi:WD40 repeat protein